MNDKPMKQIRNFTLFAALLVLVASSCIKDPEPTGGGGTNTDPTTSVRYTAMQDTVVLPGVFVGITPNQADRDNGIYLFTQTTNAAGWVEFEDLEALTYWYSASYSAPGGAIVRKGSITLEDGDQVSRTISF
jgi:hypothetical protein